jgi:hypothetical protein
MIFFFFFFFLVVFLRGESPRVSASVELLLDLSTADLLDVHLNAARQKRFQGIAGVESRPAERVGRAVGCFFDFRIAQLHQMLATTTPSTANKNKKATE